MYCRKCGTELLPEQTVCSNCGEIQEPQAEQTNKEKEYSKYTENVKRVNILTLATQAITIALLITLFFVPIFKYSIDWLAELQEYNPVAYAYLELPEPSGSFSLFDETREFISCMKSEETDDFSIIIAASYGLFFVILLGIFYLAMMIYSLFKTANALRDIENETLLTYTQMQKTGSTGSARKRDRYNRNLSIILFVVFIILDILISKLLLKMSDTDIFSYIQRKMFYLSGVSVAIALPVVLLIAYIVVENMRKKEIKAMLVDITKKEYT